MSYSNSSEQKAGGAKLNNIYNMLHKIKEAIEGGYSKAICTHRSKRQQIYDYEHIQHYLSDDTKLTKEEISLIYETWGSLHLPIKNGLDFFRGLKPLFGFKPDFVPSSYFFPYIENILNPIAWKRLLSHKAMLEMLYGSGVRTPLTVLRSYGGVYLDKNYKPLTSTEATHVISECDFDLLYKPATDSEQGIGIEKYDVSKIPELVCKLRNRSILSNNSDFVIQKLIDQDPETAIFNPSSLNCMRITTLNLNGHVSVGSMAIKCGPKNSVVDNIGSGKRGVIVGISSDGTVANHGFYGNGETTLTHNGIKFEGKKIKSFPKLISTAINLHRFVPMCSVIGWDLALDSESNPILIEGNTVYPGISLEQMCSGPIFGERTDEVIDFLKYKIGKV